MHDQKCTCHKVGLTNIGQVKEEYDVSNKHTFIDTYVHNYIQVEEVSTTLQNNKRSGVWCGQRGSSTGIES